MAIEVTRMTEADIDGAIDTIQQAFADDPYSKWIYNDRSKFNPTRNRASLRLRCNWGITHGLFHVAKDPSSSTPNKVLGTAITWTLWLNQILMNLTYGRGGLNVKRYYIWKAAQAEAQGELWMSEMGYYFCNIVTVLPEAQGKGVGRALMETVLEMADREGRWCYLESSRRVPNVAIYEKFGFRLVKEMLCDDEGDAIHLYCMMRAPRAELADKGALQKADPVDVEGA
ncbi:hypothetical protein H2199_007352 [Coniosporium tulheliwenetii]|uniref:Uncharacterized protein n=1 Tax=Coniosporium tulheliwenetii TaxID=3383036 RepID=A0ACC2YR10_9PEZI|nr:hypothetical protein H2199_007352 [Cladosporium sp. JES 115]